MMLSFGNGAAGMMHGGDRGPRGDGLAPGGDHDQALADALGISLEDLQAAYADAQAAALAQAVEDGLLTQEQADQMQNFADGHGGHFFGDVKGEYLADALGISVEDLQAAEQEARASLLADAVEAGVLTQEQVDLMTAREAINPYLPDAFAAAYEDAINQALADGVITQEQADLLLENAPTQGPGGPGFNDGFGGRGHHGGPGGMPPFDPDNQDAPAQPSDGA
jgi:hypothetical protein